MDPDLADDYVYWDTRLRYDFSQSYAGRPGMVSVGMEVDVPQNFSDNYWLLLYLDGEVISEYRGWEANDSHWGNYDNSFNHTFKVPPGLHALGIELLGLDGNDVISTQLLNDTRMYYYAALEEEQFMVRDFIENGCGTAILSGEIDLTLDSWPTSPIVDHEEHMSVFLEDGSRLSIHGGGDATIDPLRLQASGQGSLELIDVETDELWLTLDGCSLTCGDVVSNEIYIVLGGGEHRIWNLTGNNGTAIYLNDGAVLQMVDSMLSVVDSWYGSYFGVSEATAILDNITVGDDFGRDLSISVGRNGTLQLTNSSFKGAGLFLFSSVYSKPHLAVNATVIVADCVFEGGGTLLSVHDYSNSWIGDCSFVPQSRIHRNRFSGEDAWLTCHRHLLDWILEDNVVEEGCSIYAMYELGWRWPEGKSSSDYRVEYSLDEEIIRLSEEILGRERDRWDPIYAEGTLDPLAIEDPEPVPVVIKEEYYSSHSTALWVIGFSYIDPMVSNAILEIPEWENAYDLVKEYLEGPEDKGS
jgi:hypothetical protein